MALTSILINGYRSVRRLALPIEPCSVFVGANGTGKTNLYRALALLRAAADGSITRAIAEEGGIASVMWAGERRRSSPARIAIKGYFEADCGQPAKMYEIEVGLPRPTDAAFRIEPLVKLERLSLRVGSRETVLMERKGPAVMLRNEAGKRETHGDAILASETALSAFRDATRYPELESVRRELCDWRMYHGFRTDAASPIRQPCHAIAAPTLAADGRNLAAVIATLAFIRQDTAVINQAVDDAFPGAVLTASDEGSWCSLALQFPDMPRAFAAQELSDGTLKYLCLLGALLGYRLPALVALNEPEASLHPSLIPPLARMIARAARHTRIWVVTHSDELADAICEETGAHPRRVIKVNGATNIEGLKLSGEYRE